MFRTIVVPLDGSALAEGALRPAAALARRLSAEVVLVHVVPPTDGHFWPEDYFAWITKTIDAPKVSVETVTAPDAASSVVEVANGLKDSLVCLAAHGRSGVGYLVMGSTAEAILRGLAQPVMVVGPNGGGVGWEFEGGAFERLVVALDGSELAEQALAPAMAWAADLGSHVTLVQVTDGQCIPAGEDVLETGYLARVAARASSGPGVSSGMTIDDWDVIHDHHPAAGIVRFAAERQASLIALSTHGRSGLSRVVMGSVAMAVVHAAPCPVLVVPATEP